MFKRFLIATIMNLLIALTFTGPVASLPGDAAGVDNSDSRNWYSADELATGSISQ